MLDEVKLDEVNNSGIVITPDHYTQSLGGNRSSCQNGSKMIDIVINLGDENIHSIYFCIHGRILEQVMVTISGDRETQGGRVILTSSGEGLSPIYESASGIILSNDRESLDIAEDLSGRKWGIIQPIIHTRDDIFRILEMAVTLSKTYLKSSKDLTETDTGNIVDGLIRLKSDILSVMNIQELQKKAAN